MTITSSIIIHLRYNYARTVNHILKEESCPKGENKAKLNFWVVPTPNASFILIKDLCLAHKSCSKFS